MKRIVIAAACVGAVLFCARSSSAQACDPNEECNRCILPNPFGGCIQYGNDPACEVRKAVCRNTGIPVPPSPTPPSPVNVESCIKNPAGCPAEILKSNPIAIGQPIVQAYLNDLRSQAGGRWKALPSEFVDEFAPHFPEIDLRKVRYANDIDTKHGQSMTLCNEVFLAETFDDGDRSSLELMLHELYHTVQCKNRGGVGPFVDEYVAHSIGTVIEKRSFNVHDDIGHERDAAQRARVIINTFGWPFVITNGCDKRVQLLVRYKNTSGNWTTGGWYTFEPGERAQLNDPNSTYMHSKNSIWYIFATVVNGNYQWAGDHPIDFQGQTYNGLQRTRPSDSEYAGTKLTCAATQAAVQPLPTPVVSR